MIDGSDTYKGRRHWHGLRGTGALWHRTTLAALPLILQDGEITPNRGQFVREFGQADVSYGRYLGGVSLLDYDSETEERIEEHDWKYNIVARMPPQVLIKIRREALVEQRLLLPAVMSAGTDPRLDALPDDIRRMRMYVPAIEAIYLAPIPASAFAGFSLVAAGDAGVTLWREFPADGIGDLYQVAEYWVADDAQRKTARRARGEYTHAELLEQAGERRKSRTPEEVAKLRAELRGAFDHLKKG